MKKIWYYFLRTYTQLGFLFYFKRIHKFGIENIPKNKAVLFVCNHPNALIDPLLIATTNHRITYFFTRASVFKKGIVEKLLHSVNMLPVYRIRDGINTIKKNEAVFAFGIDRLKEKFALLIFAEGSHSLLRKVRPLSKGFTRVVFGALEKYPDLEIAIVPVGINYSEPTNMASEVSIFYGKPIEAKNYYNPNNLSLATTELVKETSFALKEIVCHIETEEYETALSKFSEKDFLDPTTFNQKVQNFEELPIPGSEKSNIDLFRKLFEINSFFPFLIWKNVSGKITENEFIATFKFALGITVFPIFYLIQAVIVGWVFGENVGWIYFFLSLLIVFIYSKTKR